MIARVLVEYGALGGRVYYPEADFWRPSVYPANLAYLLLTPTRLWWACVDAALGQILSCAQMSQPAAGSTLRP